MKNNITFLVIMGIVVMLIMMVSVLLAVLFNQRKKVQHRKTLAILKEQQQNQLLEAAIISEETERHRIAETLHDEVGAILSSAKLHLLGIKEESLDEKDRKIHAKGREMLNEVIKTVRGVSHNLHSNILQEFGLNEAISDFLRKITQGTVITSSTKLDETYKTEKKEKDIGLYRIIQELLNNILKYANANEINISSAFVNEILTIHIKHNGNGLSQQEYSELLYKKEGLGLKNIKNRITLLHGNIHFYKDDNGSSINIEVPVSNNTAG